MMSKLTTNKLTVSLEDDGIRIDKFLVKHNPNETRSALKNYFDQGLVLVNGKNVKPSFIVHENDAIDISDLEIKTSTVEKENIPLDIVYEDEDVLVVNKPSGMVVHPAFGHHDGTLVNALMYHCTDLSEINGVIRAGIVHRIDKDTSGLLVVCKNDAAHHSLSNQLKAKTTTRKYIALVNGVIDHNYGKIVAPIGRDPKNRQRQAVVADGKEAITHFKVLERFKDATLIECQLETGRTHQIRVHMAYIGHPVIGDLLYGTRRAASPFGQYLHAKTLGFIHPKTNKYMEFTSELPKEFEDMIASLKK